jgi:hypothetical protein
MIWLRGVALIAADQTPVRSGRHADATSPASNGTTGTAATSGARSWIR